MGKQIIGGTIVLVAIYLGVAYATGAGTLLGTAFSGYSGAVRTLQGR